MPGLQCGCRQIRLDPKLELVTNFTGSDDHCHLKGTSVGWYKGPRCLGSAWTKAHFARAASCPGEPLFLLVCFTQ